MLAAVLEDCSPDALFVFLAAVPLALGDELSSGEGGGSKRPRRSSLTA
jgi:hypothetical protein